MQQSATKMSRIVAAALAAASIEWYDFFIYGIAAATVFPALFFPQSEPLVGTLLSFGTFAIGFIARPVGGVIFGHFGDRVGRKRALVAALLLMGCATTAIGLLPTYATIGVAAPCILIVLRFMQGLAIGGQWGGAALLLIENAPPGRRGFFGSFAQLGVPVGVVLANLVFIGVTAQFGEQGVLDWAWRVPFLLSIALVGIGIYVQIRLEETPDFVRVQQLQARQAQLPQRSPILRALREHPRTIALAAGAFVALNGNFYILITYVIAYWTKSLHLPQSTVLAAVMIGSLVQAPMLVIAAAISDRHGRRGIFMAGAALMGLWSFVFFPLVELQSLLGVAIAVAVGQAFVSLMYGPQAALFGELFPTEVRYSGASLGYQIGSIFGGAFAPLIAAALLGATGSSTAIGVYMATLCAVSFFSVRLLRETHHDPA